MRHMTSLLGLIAFACLSLTASAAVMPLEDPEAYGSWRQKFEVNGSDWPVNGFTTLQCQIISVPGSQNSFATPVAFELYKPTAIAWEQIYNDGQLLVAEGLSTTWAQFYLGFAGTKYQPVAFHCQIYDGTVCKENLDWYYNGSGSVGGWSSTEGTWVPPVLIPEPTALVVLLLGGLALIRRQR